MLAGRSGAAAEVASWGMGPEIRVEQESLTFGSVKTWRIRRVRWAGPYGSPRGLKGSRSGKLNDEIDW